jgi:hypothetical protein
MKEKGRKFIFTNCNSALNKELNKCNVHSLPNMMSIIIFRTMRWAGHVEFTEEMRNDNTILIAKPIVQKRPLKVRPDYMCCGSYTNFNASIERTVPRARDRATRSAETPVLTVTVSDGSGRVRKRVALAYLETLFHCFARH